MEIILAGHTWSAMTDSNLIIILGKEYTNIQWNKVCDMLETNTLIDITAIDWQQCQVSENRFSILVTMANCKDERNYIRVDLEDGLTINSISDIFRSANFAEREIYDLFGIIFVGHPDLRRILTDYGFVGFPLRKDFPLIGYNEIFYSVIEKGIIQRKVIMAQEYRTLRTITQWHKERIVEK
jgi:NADH-quinone oxidoreductase subunit C